MGRLPASLTNERREKVWLLMLKGHNAQTIKKELNMKGNIVYRDIRFLESVSQKYVYNIAKGGFALAYERSIEGISYVMSQAYEKFDNPQVSEKSKPYYLRLIKDCHESMIRLMNEGPRFMVSDELTNRARELGIIVGDGDNFEAEANRDTSDPHDFPQDPMLVLSGCMRRFGGKMYSHQHGADAEFCYMLLPLT